MARVARRWSRARTKRFVGIAQKQYAVLDLLRERGSGSIQRMQRQVAQQWRQRPALYQAAQSLPPQAPSHSAAGNGEVGNESANIRIGDVLPQGGCQVLMIDRRKTVGDVERRRPEHFGARARVGGQRLGGGVEGAGKRTFPDGSRNWLTGK